MEMELMEILVSFLKFNYADLRADIHVPVQTAYLFVFLVTPLDGASMGSWNYAFFNIMLY